MPKYSEVTCNGRVSYPRETGTNTPGAPALNFWIHWNGTEETFSHRTNRSRYRLVKQM